MAGWTLWRRWNPARACKRSLGPGIELLEHRITPASSTSNSFSSLAQFFDVYHGPTDAPLVASNNNVIDVYTMTQSSSTPAAPISLNQIVGSNGPVTIGGFPAGSSLVSDGFGYNSGLATDSAGDAFGAEVIPGPTGTPVEAVYEVPFNSQTAQLVPADIDGATGGGQLESLAVGDGSIFGVTVASSALGQNSMFTTTVTIWQMPIGGEPDGDMVHVLGTEQLSPSPVGHSAPVVDGLTVGSGALWAVTNGYSEANGSVVNSDGVFSVSEQGGQVSFVYQSQDYLDPQLVVTNGFVYGTEVPSNSSPTGSSPAVFQAMIGQYLHQEYPITVGGGNKPIGGLVNDQGALLGVLASGSAGPGSIFSVTNYANATSANPPTMTTLSTLAPLNPTTNDDLTPLPDSALALDSAGNAYGMDYGTSASGASYVGVYTLSNINPNPVTSTATMKITVSSPTQQVGAYDLFTVTVSPPAGVTTVPTGNVTFTLDGGSPQTVPLTNGQAQVFTYGLTANVNGESHVVVAIYQGDDTFGPIATPATTPVTITPAPLTFGLSLGTNPGTLSIVLTASFPAVMPTAGLVNPDQTPILGPTTLPAVKGAVDFTYTRVSFPATAVQTDFQTVAGSLPLMQGHTIPNLASGQWTVTGTFDSSTSDYENAMSESLTLNIASSPPPKVTTSFQKGVSTVEVGFTGSVDPSAVENKALYTVSTPVVEHKKHKKLLVEKPLAIKKVTYDGSNNTVTLTLAKAFKGTAQVTVGALDGSAPDTTNVKIG